MSFKIGHTYDAVNGNKYTCVGVENGFGIFRFNQVLKRFKITKYCGVDSVIQYGNVLFKSENIMPTEDDDLDLSKQPVIYKLNKNNERYIDVFKRHKAEL
jgi:hypothetical protein